MKVLYYLEFNVFAVKRRHSRVMDEGSGTDVRHTWCLKSHPFSACGTMASSGATLPQPFYLQNGDRTDPRGLNRKNIHTVTSAEYRAAVVTFVQSGMIFVVLSGSDPCSGAWFVLLLMKASGQTSCWIFMPSFLVKLLLLLRSIER